MLRHIRNLDGFGSGLRFSLLGKQEYQTIGGGLVTFCLRTMIVIFLCMKMLAVVNYRDPQISGYTIFEDRSAMPESLNFEEMNAQVYFAFYSP